MTDAIRTIALVAHDNRKPALADWVQFNRGQLDGLTLISTGTTGGLIAERTGLDVIRLKSGPHGGDQQIGARIAEGGVDMLIFFWDPLEPMPHDPDIRALLRLATLWNIPIASNESTADFLISSPCFQAYDRAVPGLGN
ncbi:methylglyoxal synthase [Vreelandella utahensis]|uniref:methylglyoxal synthase n=1 Tax=Vreelandella halophila TaxID=86177 RepID=UPI0009879CFA|nr:methylglyoxal synthase [Halomonas utahensis]